MSFCKRDTMEHKLVSKSEAETDCVFASIPLIFMLVPPLSGRRYAFKSCFILEHQWPSASLRCGPVNNSSQPGSSLKNTSHKRPSAWLCDETRLLVGYFSIGLLVFSVWRVSLRAVSVLMRSFLDMSGSHRKNSWRRVLTVSGHSIMTM